MRAHRGSRRDRVRDLLAAGVGVTDADDDSFRHYLPYEIEHTFLLGRNGQQADMPLGGILKAIPFVNCGCPHVFLRMGAPRPVVG